MLTINRVFVTRFIILVSVISSKCINPNIWIKNGHNIDNVYNVYYITQKLHKHLYSVSKI